MKRPSKDLPPHNTVWIDISDFEFVCFNLAQKLLTFNEPIPDYSTRDNSLLESSLASPRNAAELGNANFIEQASVLFYSLIKNHPFKNGNKRIAVMTLLIFLAINKKWIRIKPKQLYKLAIITASSEASLRDMVLKENAKLIEEYLIDLPH